MPLPLIASGRRRTCNALPRHHATGAAFAPLAAVVLASALLAACGGDTFYVGPDKGDGGGQSPLPPVTLGNATLSWYPPTERTDGSPLNALKGYRIVYGLRSRMYDYSIELTNPGLTRYVIDGLTTGTWYFAIIAIDAQGLESAPSAEARKTIG
jgi:hypothetical protein